MHRVLQPTTVLAILLAYGCATATTTSTVALKPTSCAALQAAQSDTTIYDSTQVTEKPVRRTNGPVPTYPRQLQIARIGGDALFDFVISPTGIVEPTSIRATGSRQEFIDAARPHILGVRYWPACLGGRPVRYHARTPVIFTIRG